MNGEFNVKDFEYYFGEVAKSKMDPDQKEEWVAALRSGKYPQTNGDLHNEKGFCCLGVLCDIVEPNSWEPIVDLDGYVNMAKFHPLATAGGGMIHGEFYADLTLEEGVAHHLAELNDTGFTFAQIADIIEAYL